MATKAKDAARLEKWRRPGSFCLMPKGDESVWDIRGDLSFVHLYCTDAHLRRVGEEVGPQPGELHPAGKDLRQR